MTHNKRQTHTHTERERELLLMQTTISLSSHREAHKRTVKTRSIQYYTLHGKSAIHRCGRSAQSKYLSQIMNESVGFLVVEHQLVRGRRSSS